MENPTTLEASIAPRPRHRVALAGLIGAVAVVALAGVLRFEGLGRDSLWFDEAVSLDYARWPVSHPQHWNNGMALFHSILHVWIRVAGESEAALRFPSALFGVAAVALLIGLVRRTNGWTAALAAGLMLAVAWRHVYYGQEARSYSLFIMLAVLATLLLVRFLERPSPGRLIAYGVALVALAYSHYQWVFVLVFHDLAVLCSRRRVGWGWLALHAAVAVAYVPQIVLGILPQSGWSPFYIMRRPSVFMGLWAVQDYFAMALHRPIVSALPAGRDLNVLALYVLPVVAAAGIASCALPLVLRSAPRLRRLFPNLTRYVAPASSRNAKPNVGWLPLVWFGVVFVMPFLIAQTGKPVFRWRYTAGALPAYCWFIGLAVAALPRAWLRAVLAVVCVALAVPALSTMKAVPQREDWRGCVEAIMTDERPGDRIVLSHFRIRRPFGQYYHGTLPVTGVNFRLTADTEITEALAWAEPPQRVWLVVSHNPEPENIIGYFERRDDYRLIRNYDLDYRDIQLVLFERVAPAETPQG